MIYSTFARQFNNRYDFEVYVDALCRENGLPSEEPKNQYDRREYLMAKWRNKNLNKQGDGYRHFEN